ncbi:MAG: hypothetical protein ACE5HS_16170, partial [bacterium]
MQRRNKPQQMHFACFRVFHGLLPGVIVLVAAFTASACQRSPEPLRANAGPPQRVFVGEMVQFHGASSLDLKESKVTFIWDFDWDFSDANIQLDSEE